MKFKIFVVLLMVMLLAAATLYAAAGSVTSSVSWISGQRIKKVIISWVSGTAGEGVPDGTIEPLNGNLLKVEAHVSGTINPAADYDITLIEHLNGSLNLFTSHTNGSDMAVTGETFYPSHNNGTLQIYPIYSATPLTFTHSNSTVNSAAGEVILYVEVPE